MRRLNFRQVILLRLNGRQFPEIEKSGLDRCLMPFVALLTSRVEGNPSLLLSRVRAHGKKIADPRSFRSR
jgi:hypothetical protein